MHIWQSNVKPRCTSDGRNAHSILDRYRIVLHIRYWTDIEPCSTSDIGPISSLVAHLILDKYRAELHVRFRSDVKLSCTSISVRCRAQLHSRYRSYVEPRCTADTGPLLSQVAHAIMTDISPMMNQTAQPISVRCWVAQPISARCWVAQPISVRCWTELHSRYPPNMEPSCTSNIGPTFCY